MQMGFAAVVCFLLAAPGFCLGQSQQQGQTSPQLQSAQMQTSQQNPGAQNSQAPLHVDGNVMQKGLLHMVSPIYPDIAKAAHVSGTVVLHAIIFKDGSVKDLKVISGPSLLVGAAMEAVKEWRYQPTLLNGQPVEVETILRVVFTLSGSSTAPASVASSQNETHRFVSVVPAPTAAIDPQLKAAILKLLDVMHTSAITTQLGSAMMQQLRPAMTASLPPTPHRDQIVDAYIAKLNALLVSQDALDRMAEVYARHFSIDDVNAMIQFYQTPAGQHALAVLPQVMAESSQMGSEIVRENLPRILSELCKEYPELQGKAKFCPAASQSESSQLLRKELKPAADSLALSHAGAR